MLNMSHAKARRRKGTKNYHQTAVLFVNHKGHKGHKGEKNDYIRLILFPFVFFVSFVVN